MGLHHNLFVHLSTLKPPSVSMSLSLIAVPLLMVSRGDAHCGTFEAWKPQLAVQTAWDTEYADTDGRFYAAVYADGAWSDWRKLDNPGCDDREKQQFDFYDDFEDVNKKWEGVSFYSCANDGWALYKFCGFDGALNGNCVEPGKTGDYTKCKAPPQSIWIDGDHSDDCRMVTMDTVDGSRFTNGGVNGGWWLGWNTPSTVPNCVDEVGAKVDDGAEVLPTDEFPANSHTLSTVSFEISSPTLFLAVAVMVALNITLLCIICCRKARKSTVYQKVEMVSSAEVDEEEPMM